ncbi:MAG TPA: hypothetical protein VEK84_14245 [Terriglobales bacterium]|nr:hypothetical protein [Terriglobales bacterium]
MTKDIVTIIGTIGALVIGVIGLTTWRRQLRGTSAYDVAKRAVLLTYQLRDAMQAVRNPMLYLRKEEVEVGRRLEEEQRIYDERKRRLQEKWAELRTLSLEARVIWGEEAEACFTLVEKLVRELLAEIWLHFWLKGAYAGPGAAVDNNPERVAANDKIVYGASDDDEFSKRIDVAVDQVEEFFKPRIRG